MLLRELLEVPIADPLIVQTLMTLRTQIHGQVVLVGGLPSGAVQTVMTMQHSMTTAKKALEVVIDHLATSIPYFSRSISFSLGLMISASGMPISTASDIVPLISVENSFELYVCEPRTVMYTLYVIPFSS